MATALLDRYYGVCVQETLECITTLECMTCKWILFFPCQDCLHTQLLLLPQQRSTPTRLVTLQHHQHQSLPHLLLCRQAWGEACGEPARAPCEQQCGGGGEGGAHTLQHHQTTPHSAPLHLPRPPSHHLHTPLSSLRGGGRVWNIRQSVRGQKFQNQWADPPPLLLFKLFFYKQ